MARVTFVSDPLKPFGDFFNDSWTMDLSLFSYCFQSCFYCFANLNKTGMGTAVGSQVDPTDLYMKKARKALGQGYDPTSLLETFIRERYVTIFSNNVDPFYPPAEEKYHCAERLLRFWQEEKMPIFVQTKEVFTPGPIFDLLCEMKDQLIVYVTITTIDEPLSKETERYAPTPEERFRRIEALTAKGVHCVVGLNPYLPEWCKDIPAFFRRVKASGAKGVATQTLHFSQLQSRQVPEKFKHYVKKANQYDAFDVDKLLMEEVAAAEGLMLHYGRRMGDDFVKGNSLGLKQFEGDAHWLHENLAEAWVEEGRDTPVLVTWKEAAKYYGQFPIMKHVVSSDEILKVIARDNAAYFAAKAALGKKTTLLHVMHYLWNMPSTSRGIANFKDMFPLSVDDTAHDDLADDDDDVILEEDEHGDLLWVFNPKLKAGTAAHPNSEVDVPQGFVEFEAPAAGTGVLPWRYIEGERS